MPTITYTALIAASAAAAGYVAGRVAARGASSSAGAGASSARKGVGSGSASLEAAAEALEVALEHVDSAADAVAIERLCSRRREELCTAAGSAAGGAGGAAARRPPPYKAVLLSLKQPRQKRDRRENLRLLEAAVKLASDTVYVTFEGLSSNVRVGTEVLVDGLSAYDDFWDAAIGAKPPALRLRCRVLLPSQGSSMADVSAVTADPTLGAICGEETSALTMLVASVRAARASAGLPDVAYISLTDTLKKVRNPEYIAIDDVRGRLPSFGRVVLGGTFDHMHVGHMKLLTVAALVARESILIGVTSDAMLTGKELAGSIESADARCQHVRDFLGCVNPSLRVDVVMISDAFGPTITDPDLDALVVSSETVGAAAKINAKREERGFAPLSVVVKQRDAGSTVSSTFVRRGLLQQAEG